MTRLSSLRWSLAEEIVNIQDLNGVGPVTAGKLRDAGYDSIASLAIAPIKELVEKAGLENSTAQKISRAARQTIQTDYITAKQLWEKRQTLQKLSFGSSNLNKLLGGGLETQAITEFVGEFGAGKSQICMKLSVNVQLPTKDGGLEGKALFIDTEGTFAAQRVYQMAQAMGLDADKILDGIIYSRVYNSDHQILTVDHAFKICQEENIKLLVVDSILSHFRGEYIGRESLSERQQRLNSHLHKLLRIAQAPTHRVMLKKASQGLRVAKIIDSPYLPESETYFQITAKGVEDAAPKSRRDE